MQAVENTVENAAKLSRTRGLKPPWKKGVKQKAGPGRPKTVDFAAAFRSFASTPERQAALFKALLKKKPDIAMAHLAGKPVETQLQLTGAMAQEETEKAVARILAAGGIQSPSPEIKTPHIES